MTVGGLTVDGASRCVRFDDDPTIYAVTAERLAPVLAVAESGLEG